MPTRISYLFALTTAPDDRETASPHSAGWSESWWRAGVAAAAAPEIAALAQSRAALLSSQASIIGFRLAVYTLAGNKIVPVGTKTGKFQYPGPALYNTDLPQVALEMSGKTGGGPNTSRFTMRGVPDPVMIKGEYQPIPAWKGLVTRFTNRLVADGWNFLGRDLAQPVAQVLTIANGVMTTDGGLGVAQGDYIRLLRVFDVNKQSIQGSFRVTVVGAGNAYTLAGMDAGVSVLNSGAARKDVVAVFPFSEVSPARAVVRKVGRPFESYRGRRSKR